MDAFFMALYAISSILSLVVTGGLWWAAHRSEETSPFWRMLALGWSLSLAGNLAWTVYDMVGGKSLPTLSWIDGFYLGRYLLIWLAFWRYPAPFSPWRGLEVLAAMAISGLLAWVGLFQPVLTSTERSLPYFLGVAIYPVLDAALVYTAWIRWRQVITPALKQAVLVLILAMLVYGVANWINFGVRMVSLDAESLLATLAWTLSDGLLCIAIVVFLRQRDELMRRRS